jgi:hypothetical protein
VPWGDAPSPNISFDLALVFVRSPKKAIPSIVMENTNPQSFRFRRFHIYNLEKVDIALFKTSLERAIASYVYWYKIALKQKQNGIIRVENLHEDILSLSKEFSKIDFRITDEIVQEASLLEVRSNDSMHKFDFPKPVFSPQDWDAVNKDLIDELRKISLALGYKDIDL